jgi:hypothetical protein
MSNQEMPKWLSKEMREGWDEIDSNSASIYQCGFSDCFELLSPKITRLEKENRMLTMHIRNQKERYGVTRLEKQLELAVKQRDYEIENARGEDPLFIKLQNQELEEL